MKLTCLPLILIFATSLPAQEASESNVVATIHALERAWIEADASNDNGALDQIFDNHLVYIEYGRLLTKAEYLSKLRSAGPHQRIVTESMSVRTFGETAIVIATYREEGVKHGKRFRERWRCIDTWTFKHRKWMLVAAAAAPLSR